MSRGFAKYLERRKQGTCNSVKVPAMKQRRAKVLADAPLPFVWKIGGSVNSDHCACGFVKPFAQQKQT